MLKNGNHENMQRNNCLLQQRLEYTRVQYIIATLRAIAGNVAQSPDGLNAQKLEWRKMK